MKNVFAFLIFLMSVNSFAAPAGALDGTYTVVQGCKVNNSRLAVLELMYFEGTPVTIESRSSEGLLTFTAEHNTLALPFSSDTNLQHTIFEDYYTNADIRVTQTSYAMKTKGSRLGLCDNRPLPGSHPCLHKWNDAVAMVTDNQGQLQIEWKIENARGTCLLQRQN